MKRLLIIFLFFVIFLFFASSLYAQPRGGLESLFNAKFLNYYPSLSNVITDIGSDNKEVYLTSNETISSDLTIPLNVRLKFAKGIKIALTDTLTVLGELDAGFWQIFDLSGNGYVDLSNANVTNVYPQWFGAVGDGVTDDASPFDFALESGLSGKTLFVPKGNYLIDTKKGLGAMLSLDGIDGLTIRGDGTESKLVLGIDPTDLLDNHVILTLTRSSNILVSDLYFDGQGDSQSLEFHNLKIDSCQNVVIQRVYSTNAAGGHLIGIYSSNNVIVDKCNAIDTPVGSGGHGIDVDVSTTFSDSVACSDITIQNCYISNIAGVQKAENVNGFKFSNNTIYAATGTPAMILGSNATHGTPETTHSNWLIEGNSFYDGGLQFDNPIGNDLKIQVVNNLIEGILTTSRADALLDLDVYENTINPASGVHGVSFGDVSPGSVFNIVNNDITMLGATDIGITGIIQGSYNIKDNRLSGGKYGVFLTAADTNSISITYNKLYGNGILNSVGINVVTANKSLRLENNEIGNYNRGVDLVGKNDLVKNNIIKTVGNSPKGIHLKSTSGNSILEGNYIESQDSGVVGSSSAIYIESDSNKICNNKYFNWKLGSDIRVTADDNLIENNELRSDTLFNTNGGFFIRGGTNNIIAYNRIASHSTTATKINDLSGGANTIRENIDYITNNSGSVTIAASTSANVTHGLSLTPNIKNIVVTPQTNLAGVSFWIDNVTSTIFRVNVSSSTTASFSWHIKD